MAAHRLAFGTRPEGGLTVAQAWTDAANVWARDGLPELNGSASAGRTTADEIAYLVNEASRSAPLPHELDDRQAMQVLMILGVCGSSVERHAAVVPLKAFSSLMLRQTPSASADVAWRIK